MLDIVHIDFKKLSQCFNMQTCSAILFSFEGKIVNEDALSNCLLDSHVSKP
jgi:hypothetical protein